MSRLDDLPEDNELAFGVYERKRRAELARELESIANDQQSYASSTEAELEYVNDVLGASRALRLGAFGKDWDTVPVHDQVELKIYISQFKLAAQRLSAELFFTESRRVKRYTVELNSLARDKLRHLLTQMREEVNKMDLTARKRRALISKIDALLAEIEQDKTKYEAFAALMIEAADDFGEVATRLEPVVRLVERIGAVFAGAKRDEEDRAQLPAPEKPKQIEPPKSAEIAKHHDDEIPF